MLGASINLPFCYQSSFHHFWILASHPYQEAKWCTFVLCVAVVFSLFDDCSKHIGLFQTTYVTFRKSSVVNICMKLAATTMRHSGWSHTCVVATVKICLLLHSGISFALNQSDTSSVIFFTSLVMVERGIQIGNGLRSCAHISLPASIIPCPPVSAWHSQK